MKVNIGKISFDQEDLEEMTNQEFYLAVFSDKGKEKKWFKKIKVRGSIGEIEERRPHHLKYYDLGYLSKTLLRNGRPLQDISKNFLDHYIFKLEKAIISTKVPPVLKGTACPYSLHENEVRKDLEKKVLLYMDDIPTFKCSKGIICL